MEAVVLLVIAAVVAVIAAGVWVALAGGAFSERLGLSLVVAGVIAAVTGNVAVSRMATTDTRAFLGVGPERGGDADGGGQVLTGIGIFLFVAVPLVIVGVALYS